MTREDSSHLGSDTRRRIVEAVMALVIEEHPAMISVPAVARRAGTSVATVYRYFPNKQALLDAAAVLGQEKTAAAMLSRPIDDDALDDLVARLFGELADNLPLVRGQQLSDAGRELRRSRRPLKAPHLHRAVCELGLDPDRPQTRRLLLLIELLASSTTLLELHDHLGLPIDEAAAHVAWAVRTLTRATAATIPANEGNTP